STVTTSFDRVLLRWIPLAIVLATIFAVSVSVAPRPFAYHGWPSPARPAAVQRVVRKPSPATPLAVPEPPVDRVLGDAPRPGHGRGPHAHPGRGHGPPWRD